MSTSDVPGKRESNRDTLHAGCWAEHKDGSLILVESTEIGKGGGNVLYSTFSLGSTVSEYRAAETISKFSSMFSYDPAKDKSRGGTEPGQGDGVSEEWTWHDKTPFPWQRVIDAGVRVAEARQLDPSGAVAKADAMGKGVAAAAGTDLSLVEPYATSGELLDAAQRVAATLKIKGTPFNAAGGKVPSKGGRTAKDTVLGRVGAAFKALRGG
jgi:hypothetical protein